MDPFFVCLLLLRRNVLLISRFIPSLLWLVGSYTPEPAPLMTTTTKQEQVLRANLAARHKLCTCPTRWRSVMSQCHRLKGGTTDEAFEERRFLWEREASVGADFDLYLILKRVSIHFSYWGECCGVVFAVKLQKCWTKKLLQTFHQHGGETDWVSMFWENVPALTQWRRSVCRRCPSHWAPRCRSPQGWCFLTPSGSERPRGSWYTPSAWWLEVTALQRGNNNNNTSESDFKGTSQNNRTITSAVRSEMSSPGAGGDIYYLSCIRPSRWLGWCRWCWWQSPTARTERWAAGPSRCSGSPSLSRCWLEKRAQIVKRGSHVSRCVCRGVYLAVHRCCLPACPPAPACSRDRSTPPCRRRTSSSAHAATSGWQSSASGGWWPEQTELLRQWRNNGRI